MENYEQLKDKQLSIRDKLVNLVQKFQKYNQERRALAAKDFFQIFDELEEEFGRNKAELNKLNSKGALSSRSYFKEEFGISLQKSFIEKREAYEKYLSVTLEQEENPINMDALTTLVKEMAELQAAKLRQRAARPANNTALISYATKLIKNFDKKDIANFLDSVETAVTGIEDQGQMELILRIAKQKVTCLAMENVKYQDFETFKTDVLKYFKPTRSRAEVEMSLAALTQGSKESVDEYSKRVYAMRADYEMALRAEYNAKGYELSKGRIEEMETSIALAFRNNLKQHVLLHTLKKDTLADAVAEALGAEALSNARYEKEKYLRQSTSGDKGRAKVAPSYEKKSFDRAGKSQGPSKTFDSAGKNKAEKGPVVCYGCGGEGHKKPECPKAQEKAGEAKTLTATPKPSKSKNESGGAIVSAKTLKIKKQH